MSFLGALLPAHAREDVGLVSQLIESQQSMLRVLLLRVSPAEPTWDAKARSCEPHGRAKVARGGAG